MYDLLSFKEQRIDALMKEVNRLKEQNEKYSTFIFELMDKDCPEDYKNVIKNEIWSLEKGLTTT